MEGAAREMEEDSVLAAKALYVAKFPFAAALLAHGSEIADKAAGTRFFAFSAQRLYLIDNRAGFGNRQEVELPAR